MQLAASQRLRWLLLVRLAARCLAADHLFFRCCLMLANKLGSLAKLLRHLQQRAASSISTSLASATISCLICELFSLSTCALARLTTTGITRLLALGHAFTPFAPYASLKIERKRGRLCYLLDCLPVGRPETDVSVGAYLCLL